MQAMRFSTRSDVENYFDDDATGDIRQALACKFIDAAHAAGLRYGDDWRAVWDSMAEPQSKFIQLCESCR